MSGGQVLLVDDDSAVREALGQTLELGGYQPVLAGSFTEAADHIGAAFDGVVVTDLRMPGKDGFALLDLAQKRDADLPVILLTGEGDIRTAVRGMSMGAFDFLEKPCDPKHLLEVVDKALRTRKLVLENRRLKEELEKAQREKIPFLGTSTGAQRVRDAIRRAARVQATVLICGERGTGRGHVARLIQAIRAPERAIFRVECVPHMEWATVLDCPDDAVCLLCDVGRLDAAGQMALTTLLTNHPGRIGYATGDAALEAELKAGNFSDDLFYALGLVRIDVPSLAERSQDIPILFDKFLREEIDAGAHITSAEGQAALRGLASLDWSGNLHALRNHAKRVAWGLEADEIDNSLKAQLERVENGIIRDALRRHGGNATETAQALGLPRKTFYDRLAKLAIRPEEFR